MKKYKILVVEDEAVTLKILTHILNKNNFEVVWAKDGLEAMNRFEKILPDLIISDIMLPYKSGLELAQFIKGKYPKIPFIILTALGEEEETIEKAFKLKVDDFIGKPFSANELLLRIKKLLPAD